eukprot:gb/GEZN01021675.1/.p1 GENE.gb/GEZN01021675.1/~~gb/GEZN01021675.1/.p1  ORF type:complete len:136 (+),score=4.67 gb/GEZN01021675.1/:88-495(+)
MCLLFALLFLLAGLICVGIGGSGTHFMKGPVTCTITSISLNNKKVGGCTIGVSLGLTPPVASKVPETDTTQCGKYAISTTFPCYYNAKKPEVAAFPTEAAYKEGFLAVLYAGLGILAAFSLCCCCFVYGYKSDKS